MSKIKNGGLDQYDPKPSEQQQLGTAGVERVNAIKTQQTTVANSCKELRYIDDERCSTYKG